MQAGTVVDQVDWAVIKDALPFASSQIEMAMTMLAVANPSASRLASVHVQGR